MADPASVPETPARRPQAWRPLVRSLHRDAGYLAVGLTIIYAVSGLAVNHISDWDPNFQSYKRTLSVRVPLPGEDQPAAAEVLRQLGNRDPVREVYRAGDRLDIRMDSRTLHVDTRSGRVVEEGRKSRFLLRVSNWLHLNRGKKAWTIVADAYAAGLLFLAISGLFMLPSRKGVLGRGGIFVLIGVAIPVLYVVLSGGP